MENYIVHKQIEIKGTTAAVWDALTNPEKTKKYFFHCAVYSNWKPGSDITFKGKIFFIKSIELKGKILRIEPERLLEYTLANASDHNGSYSTITDELSHANGITTLSITDNVGLGDGAEERYERSMKGWDKILKGLKELVEDQ